MQDIEELFNLRKKTFTKSDKTLIKKAYNFAKEAHGGQKRDSGQPYFSHVFETAKNLIKLGMEANVIAAGLLHDTIEDTKTTEEDLKREFGEEIAFWVKGVTKLKRLNYQGHEHYHERYVENLRKFFLAMASDLRVVIIKLADRLHNVQNLKYKNKEKQKHIALETIEIHARIADRLGMGKLKGELEDAAFPFAYPKEYQLTEKILKKRQSLYEEYLKEIQKKLTEELHKQKIKPFEIDSRVKHKYSLYQKLVKYDMDLDRIYDIVALRVIVETVEDCYAVLGLIHSIWNPLPGRIKDYIALPKLNGYRSLHTTIFTGSGGIAEIQIRTKEMHAEAEYGIAAHSIYKEQSNKKTKFKWIEELKELKYTPNEPKKFTEHLKMDFFNDRIFVFTPKGDVIDLPQDSSPIDFAYSIHSDIGNHVSSVKINNKIATLGVKLKNSDIIEIITRKEAHPSNKWLEYAKTTIAKKHIRIYLEKNSLLSKLKSFGKN